MDIQNKEICPYCRGVGKLRNDLCWHCEGLGIKTAKRPPITREPYDEEQIWYPKYLLPQIAPVSLQSSRWYTKPGAVKGRPTKFKRKFTDEEIEAREEAHCLRVAEYKKRLAKEKAVASEKRRELYRQNKYKNKSA